MPLKHSIQLKLTLLAQKGNWQNKLVKVLSGRLFWILLISGIIRLTYYAALTNTIAVDTASYLNYHANILRGETEGQRTPVYPYFIKLIGLFGRENLVDHLVTAQIIISFLSIILFYRIVKFFFKTSKTIIAASLLYGALLPVINFDKLVITESLSVSFCILFIYMMVGYLQNPGHLKAWLLTLFVFIAIMLRPSFIYWFPLVIVFWAMRLIVVKTDRKISLSGLAASAMVMLLILGYSHLNEKNAGYNGISVVSNNNGMAEIVNARLYKNGNDPEISAAIISNIQLKEKSNGKPVAGINILKRFGPDRAHSFLMNCIKNQPGAYGAYLFKKLATLRTANIFTNYADHKLNYLAFRVEDVEYHVFYIPFIILYLFLIFDLVMIIAGWIKQKKTPWFKLFLWLLITGQLAVAIIGGYSEYQRLILAAIPVLVIVLFGYIDGICFTIDRMRLKRYQQKV